MKLQTVIKRMRKHQGKRSGRQLAREFGVTPSYISQIYAGAIVPSPKILKALGIVAETNYRERKSAVR